MGVIYFILIFVALVVSNTCLWFNASYLQNQINIYKRDIEVANKRIEELVKEHLEIKEQLKYLGHLR